MVNETDCAACDFNKPGATCKRDMEWMWRGEMLPASRNEYQRIQQQLETEKFPPFLPGGRPRAFHELSKEDQAAYEKKRLSDYCRKAYKKTKVTKLETKTSTICQKENSFYVDTVRAFRDRRYEYKALTKVAKNSVTSAVASGDAGEIKAAKGREVLYDSLQLAHKCILNSFYGYVVRRGARWHSMSMAGIVCLTGAHIIMKAREIIEKIGRPLELDTDGIWCMLPASFPTEFTVLTNHPKKKKINISYCNAVLNRMVKDLFTNDQYQELIQPAKDGIPPEYKKRDENSIFFEVDGPYLAMVLPASKEEGKKLKKRYAVFNFDGSLAELKGFEVKRRGELQLIKIFQSSVFEAFLQGVTLEECYASVAKVADYWLDVLYSKGCNMPDTELFELISENRSMSKKLEEYGTQKSTSISTAKRLAEFLGDQMVKDAGLACRYIISRKPDGAPVTERAIPMAIFQSEPSIRRHYLRRWLKDNTMGDADIREILDWNYYIERLGGTIAKIITIPAALQGLVNPVPRVRHPDWLHKKILEKNDVLKQRRISEMFTSKPKPIQEEEEGCSEIGDIEDFGGSSNTTKNDRPLVTQRKRTHSRTESVEQPVYKTWKEAVGSPPSPGTTKEELINWVNFQKKKWAWQLSQKNKNLNKNKKSKKDSQKNQVASLPRVNTLGGFLRRAQRSLIEIPWQIIQVSSSDSDGHFNIWAMVGEELHKIKLIVPRIFYVNHRTSMPPVESSFWEKVHRILPRSRPVQNLYRYKVPEQIFKENGLAMLADLATPEIEGIYETQMSLEFRTLMELGCVCAVQRSEARSLISQSITNIESFTIQQLEIKSLGLQSYLHNFENKLNKIYLYQHSSQTGKREMWGLFLGPIKKAIIIVLDTVRTNQMPTMKNLYLTERTALVNSASENLNLPPEDIIFEIIFELHDKQVFKHIQRGLSSYQDEKKGPTILYIQSAFSRIKLNANMPGLLEFPQTKIHITDDASLLVGMEWQRSGARSMIRHFLNLNNVVGLMLEQCRYFHLPIGNLPADTVLFGADLFYARHLQKHNFVLWCSPSSRPDLGGREADDNTLLAEFEDNITVVQNKPGYYPNVCVELAIDSLAVSALLQANRVQEMEGASSAITFDVMPQASLQQMMGQLPGMELPSYDETALCSSAFRVMRSMVHGWLKEITINRNVYSDFQVVHFYRWIRSSTALLYDPAMRRSLNTLMRKLFLQIIAEFQRMGAEIIHADFNKIIINTGKKTIVDGISYADYIVKNIRNKELFHSVHLSYQQCWDFLLWLDPSNYSGTKGKLPNEMKIVGGEDEEEEADKDDEENEIERNSNQDEEEEDISLEMHWNISEHLTEEGNCIGYFEKVITFYVSCLAEKTPPVKAIQQLSHHAYEITQKMFKTHGKEKQFPALQFVNAVIKILSVDKEIADEVQSLKKNMLQLINVGEFSDLAVWQDPINSFVLNEVICHACNHCRDLDLCKDNHRASKDGM